MADNDRDPGGLRRSTAEFQRRAEQAAPAAGAGYTLIGAIMLLGLIGYGVDRWRDTSPWFLVGGLVRGGFVEVYARANTRWKR